MTPGSALADAFPAGVLPDGIVVAARRISLADVAALLPEERLLFGAAPPARLAASGAARDLARALAARLDLRLGPIGRTAFGAPIWPEGLVGSLAHDDTWAVAALARTDRIIRLGIDVEPLEPLPDELRDLVLTPTDRWRDLDAPHPDRIAFTAKEAVYKAVHPAIGRILEWHDITVDLAARTARVDGAPIVSIVSATTGPILTLAFVET